MAAAARDSKIHSSTVVMAAFSSGFDEVIAAEVIKTESLYIYNISMYLGQWDVSLDPI